MPEKPERIHWDRQPGTWISPVGTVLKEEKGWTGHVYRNQRAGASFTLSKTGFDSAMAAAAWVENNAEQ
jgi:hypothetical protein